VPYGPRQQRTSVEVRKLERRGQTACLIRCLKGSRLGWGGGRGRLVSKVMESYGRDFLESLKKKEAAANRREKAENHGGIR